MEFKLYSAHEGNLNENIIINTIEELQELDRRYGDNGIIIYFDIKQIWIYNDYVE